LQPFRREQRLTGIQIVKSRQIKGILMRGFILMAMFVTSFASAGWSDYEEVRDLDLDANGIKTLSIVSGPGSMDVRGVAGLDRIEVEARIVVQGKDNDQALRFLEKNMKLTLQEDGGVARLEADFDPHLFGWGADAYIVLDVSVPKGMAVDIEDAAGSIDVAGTEGDLSIDDGSGSITVKDVANLRIDDGSGSIKIANATGDVSIVDGSGSITVRHVGGSVSVDDGSGSITVSDIEKDVVIIDDGSGGLNVSDVRGTVEQET
jgi:hypothetical protein